MWIRLLITSMLFIAPVSSVFADEETFRKWDADGDGRLVETEVPSRLRVNFPRVDADGAPATGPGPGDAGRAPVRSRVRADSCMQGRMYACMYMYEVGNWDNILIDAR